MMPLNENPQRGLLPNAKPDALIGNGPHSALYSNNLNHPRVWGLSSSPAHDSRPRQAPDCPGAFSTGVHRSRSLVVCRFCVTILPVAVANCARRSADML